MNRESWLQAAVEHLTPVFKDRTGLGLPPVHVSTGWPSKGGTSAKRRRVGECWPTQEHGAQVFISPLLEDSFEVLAVLVHELVHALHPEAGHRGYFVASARSLGLVKPWTASTAGEDLEPVLARLILKLGEYPHHGITPGSPKAKPQTARMRKLLAPECGCLVRTTAKYIELGTFKCPHDNEMDTHD